MELLLNECVVKLDYGIKGDGEKMVEKV